MYQNNGTTDLVEIKKPGLRQNRVRNKSYEKTSDFAIFRLYGFQTYRFHRFCRLLKNFEKWGTLTFSNASSDAGFENR